MCTRTRHHPGHAPSHGGADYSVLLRDRREPVPARRGNPEGDLANAWSRGRLGRRPAGLDAGPGAAVCSRLRGRHPGAATDDRTAPPPARPRQGGGTLAPDRAAAGIHRSLGGTAVPHGQLVSAGHDPVAAGRHARPQPDRRHRRRPDAGCAGGGNPAIAPDPPPVCPGTRLRSGGGHRGGGRTGANPAVLLAARLLPAARTDPLSPRRWGGPAHLDRIAIPAWSDR
jgi:hypothetical protein